MVHIRKASGMMLIFILASFCRLVAQDDLDLGAHLGTVDSSNIFISPDHYTWCGSAVVGEDGRYYMFYARWPHGPRQRDDDSMNYIFDGFRGWQKYSEIAIAVSEKPTGPYRHLKTILKGHFNEDRWDRYTYHNPQVNFFNGKYYLYFISNSYNGGIHFKKPMTAQQLHWLQYNCTQKIGVAYSSTIKGFLDSSFTLKKEYLVQPDSVRTWEVAVNPSVTKGPDGRYYMMYKSRKPEVGNMTFWMAVSDDPAGPFTYFSEVMSSADMACEDPFLWYDARRKRFYAVAKNFSNSGKLAPEFGALVLISSEDGKKWTPAQHTVVSLKRLNFKDGSQAVLTQLERPFILFNRKGEMQALMAAASVKNPFENKSSNVAPAENTFNVQIPLRKKN
jgi:hypothetical protein